MRDSYFTAPLFSAFSYPYKNFDTKTTDLCIVMGIMVTKVQHILS